MQDGKADAKTYSGWVRFAAFCQVCHGVGGVGSAIAPDLAEAVKHLNHKQFETIVSCGLKGNLGTGVMPAWGSNPNIKPYLDDLWAYLRARRRRSGSRPSAEISGAATELGAAKRVHRRLSGLKPPKWTRSREFDCEDARLPM